MRILEFLEPYQKEELIWNPKHRNHKNRQKVNDAWNRISAYQYGIACQQLKIKGQFINGLFSYTNLRKKKSSIKSGMGAEDVYEPIWFAFKLMEDFFLFYFFTQDI